MAQQQLIKKFRLHIAKGEWNEFMDEVILSNEYGVRYIETTIFGLKDNDGSTANIAIFPTAFVNAFCDEMGLGEQTDHTWLPQMRKAWNEYSSKFNKLNIKALKTFIANKQNAE